MSVSFIGIKKDDFLTKDKLFKVMSLENALRCIKENYLWLANPIEWQDPFEKRFVTAKYEDERGKIKSFAWKDKVYCACFTPTVRSEAYWKVYCPNEIGIRLTIDRNELYNELKEYSERDDILHLYIGRAEYMDANKIKMSLSQIPMNDRPQHIDGANFKARLLLLKRKDFKYENEVRIIVVRKETSDAKGIKLPIHDKYKLVQQITIDPRVGKYTTEILRNYFRETLKFSPIPRGNGTFNRVVKSNLYKEDQKNLTIKI